MLRASFLQGSVGTGFCFSARPKTVAMAQSVRIVVVGDVHDDWDPQQDVKALQSLKDLHCTQQFVHRAKELVQDSNHCSTSFLSPNGNGTNVSKIGLRRALILDLYKGPSGKPLQSLGKEHVGYDRLDFPQLNLSVVGGRPFSCGGNELFHRRLIAARYEVKDMKESARKIYETALGAPKGHSIVFLAHNGPIGLGSKVNDICGKDWVCEGGDHGDPDLEEALTLFRDNSQFETPLVVFGHMHKKLANGDNSRTMLVVGDDGTIYLNGAVVPRVEVLTAVKGNSSTGPLWKGSLSDNGIIDRTKREFMVVDMVQGKPRKIMEVWVTVDEVVSNTEEFMLFQC